MQLKEVNKLTSTRFSSAWARNLPGPMIQEKANSFAISLKLISLLLANGWFEKFWSLNKIILKVVYEKRICN